jgi:putative DNA methylase
MAKSTHTMKRRLIDKGLLHLEASIAGFAERYQRGETSHTIHVWWARRPHSAMRALIFASLCKKEDKRTADLLSKIGQSAASPEKPIEEARNLLHKQYKGAPKLLDMFGGGGTIAYEALNLGCEAYSIDSNELSVFIQQCNLVYSQQVRNPNIQYNIRESGNKILRKLTDYSSPLFPSRYPSLLSAKSSVTTYLWTYSTVCKNCGYKFYLSKRRWLAKKKGKNIAFVFSEKEQEQGISIEYVSPEYEASSSWVGKNGHIRCPKCNHLIKNVSVKECKDELVALVRTNDGGGKGYYLPDESPNVQMIQELEIKLLKELNISLPTSELPVWSGIVNPALYGIRTHAEFFNPRQRLVLLFLIKALRDEYFEIKKEESKETANYVISLLSGLIDQMVDWNSRLSMWIPQNEQVGRGFCGPGISMLWDYAECDPVSKGPGNLWAKLDRIVDGSITLAKFPAKAHINRGYAQELPFENSFFDAIVTDPPYYDNIFYSVLADFFYVWKRPLLGLINPTLFRNPVTDAKRELVASSYRNGATNAHEEYCKQLSKAILEASRVLKSDGVLSFIYSHSSINGWEALVRAFRASDFVITSVQPLSIERKQRPRAMSSEAVNTCICFIGRKDNKKKGHIDIDKLNERISKICSSDFVSGLRIAGWHEEDIAIGVFAHGVALLANASKVSNGIDDVEMLVSMGKVISNEFPTFRLLRRKSL